MFCVFCGVGLPDKAPACHACGRPTPAPGPFSAGATSPATPPDAATVLAAGSSALTSLATSPERVGAGQATPAGGATLGAGLYRHAALPASLGVGSAFGNRYHIIRLLGVGGMGAVYQAWDDALGVAVALKIIRPEITADPAAARDLERRFKRELLLARQVTHKNVVRIHDLGEIDGIKYLTMPYIQGSDLATVLSREKKLSVPRAIGIARQVASGLQAAHEAGVVHRDLKPANVMIDADEQAVIMDFGIARSVSGGGATMAGAVVGTLEYMAPEQAMAQPVDHRADIYALGLMLYDMVLGPRDSSRAESAVAELMARVQKPLTPARSIDGTIPETLERVIDRCTQPDPGARYQTTAQLASDLEVIDRAVKAGSSAGALSAPPVTRPLEQVTPSAPAQRSVPLQAVVAGVALLTLVGGGWLLRDRVFRGEQTANTSAEKPVGLAVIPFHNASSDPSLNWLGPSLADMVADNIGQSARLRLARSERVAQLLRDLRIGPNTAVDGTTIKNVADFTSADHVIAGRFVKVGEQIRIETLLYAGGAEPVSISESAAGENDILRAARAIALAIQKSLSLSESEIRDLQATAFKPSSQSVQALRYYSEGVQFAAVGEHLQAARSFEASTELDPSFALAFSRLAQSLAVAGRAPEAESASRTAVSLSEKLPSEERELIAAAHARFINDLDTAVQSYERLVERRPTDVQLRFDLAALLERRGALDRARDEYAKVLELELKHVEALYAAGRVAVKRGDPNGSLVPLNQALSLSIQLDNREAKAKIMQALGNVYSDLRRPEDALKQYQDSLAIKEQIGDRRGVAASLNSIAQIYDSQGKTDDAWKAYRESIAIRRELKDREGVGIVLISLGASYLDAGRHDEALSTLKEALQIQRELGNEDRQARCLSNIGNVYFAKAEYEAARTYLERALELREKAKIPANVAYTLASLAGVSGMLGDYDDAQTKYLRAKDLWRTAGDKRGAAIGSHGLATLFAQRGRYGAAVAESNAALTTLRELQERSNVLAEVLVGHGAALSLSGRTAEAEKQLAEGLTLARELRNQTLIARTLNAQGENAFYRGAMNAARALFEQARQTAAAAHDPYYTTLARANLAKVAVETRPQTAAAELKKLIAEADSLGLKQLSAECSMHLGAALLASGNAAAASTPLQTAVSTAERLQARGLLVRTLYLLGKTQRALGTGDAGAAHLARAQQILGEMQKESQSDALPGRHDFAAVQKGID